MLLILEKIPRITDLATTDALTIVENKIPDVTNLVNKADFTTSDYLQFTNNILDAKIIEKKLVNESDISDLVKKTHFDEKLKKKTQKLP